MYVPVTVILWSTVYNKLYRVESTVRTVCIKAKNQQSGDQAKVSQNLAKFA